MKSEPIIFVGLGKMGLPMARHLYAAGHRVLGVEPSARRREALAGSGLTLCATLADACDLQPVGLIVSSLPDDAALLAVADSLVQHVPTGTAWVDTSTVSLAASREVAARCAAHGLPHLRAPVSGNAPMAESARLTVLASGDRATYDLCEPLFACWGEQRLYVGHGDEARACKLAINLMVAVTSAMLAKALVLGQAAGAARSELWRVIEASAVTSPLLRAKAPALRAHDYSATFSVTQMRKDIGLMLAAARDFDLDLPITRRVDEALAQAETSGHADEDYAVILREAERRAGLLPPPL